MKKTKMIIIGILVLLLALTSVSVAYAAWYDFVFKIFSTKPAQTKILYSYSIQ
jgi:hypothetical protein